MYWRAPRAAFVGPQRKHNKRKFKARVRKGPPPGLIAYRGAEPVGWIQVGPRADVPNWNGARRLSAPLHPDESADESIWAVSCFVVPPKRRGAGVAAALLAGAVAYARKKGAAALDACPVDVGGGKANPTSIYHGVASMFERAGFAEIARRRRDRPLMRLDLRG
jgi:predicted GNAT family acetyltransferase